MTKLKIEFFHDVICSFCFPMSYRMRKLSELMPDLEIVHKSFALVKNEEDFTYMFGSRISAKKEILHHWESANKNDDLHRFNIKKMEQANFLFPTSMNALYACKAAYLISGDKLYWDLFDKLQSALFENSENIENEDIIFACVKSLKIDFETWLKKYNSDDTKKAVEDDLLLAKKYGIQGVPCIAINGNPVINGALPLSSIIDAIENEKNKISLNKTDNLSCNINDGK